MRFTESPNCCLFSSLGPREEEQIAENRANLIREHLAAKDVGWVVSDLKETETISHRFWTLKILLVDVSCLPSLKLTFSHLKMDG